MNHDKEKHLKECKELDGVGYEVKYDVFKQSEFWGSTKKKSCIYCCYEKRFL